MKTELMGSVARLLVPRIARGLEPDAAHFAPAPIHDAFADADLADLGEIVEKVRAGEITGSGAGSVYA